MEHDDKKCICPCHKRSSEDYLDQTGWPKQGPTDNSRPEWVKKKDWEREIKEENERREKLAAEG